jgi:hypothetical protein
LKFGLWTYSYSGDTVSWNVFYDTAKDESYLYPYGWELYTKSDFLFGAFNRLNGEYFSVLKHNKEDLGLDIKSYQIGAFSTLTKGIDGLDLLSHVVLELKMRDKTAFSSMFETRIDGLEFVFFTFYMESEESIYDFTYKFSMSGDINRNEVIFWEIIEQFKDEGNTLFPSEGLEVLEFKEV